MIQTRKLTACNIEEHTLLIAMATKNKCD